MRRLVYLGIAFMVPATAAAHIEMTYPPQRYPAGGQFSLEIKDGPCGIAENPPGEVGRTTFAPGETITVTWDEFVPHPGHFRIAFDDDGDDDLLDPAGFDDYNTPGVTILLDAIPHENGKSDYSAEVTLPDIACETCTLQLIQVMTDKPPWGPEGGKDIYYQCADLVLDASAGSGTGSGTGGGESGSSSATSGGETSSGSTSGASSTSDGGSSSGFAPTDGAPNTDSASTTDSDGSSGCRMGTRPSGAVAALMLLAFYTRRRR